MNYKIQTNIYNQQNILLTDNEGITKIIPFDPANTDYQEYIKWTKASPKNVAEPADE